MARQKGQQLQPRAERTRVRLIEAARRQIVEKGYAEARVDDIAEAARLSKGAFYFHFASKEDVLLAVIEAWAKRRLIGLRSSARRRDPQEAVANLVQRLISPKAAGHKDARLLLALWSLADRNEKVRRRLAETSRSWKETLQEVLARAGTEPTRRRRAAGLPDVVLALHDGLLVRNLLGFATRSSWRSGADAATALLRDALREEAARERERMPAAG